MSNKTVLQIKKKAKTLKKQYNIETEYVYSEDMGYKYQKKLDDFIGDFYSYRYADRLAIVSIIKDLFDVTT